MTSTQCIRMALKPNAYLFFNECIPYIQGTQRGHLFKTIAYNSVALSIDQYGVGLNYILPSIWDACKRILISYTNNSMVSSWAISL